ncbi:Spartin [Strongyloides ratti]|uniref:Inheritance of peroxisomes protein 1 n=1 Tax=Strongyloides ratti TaxID=34506 RepID=A0A090MZ47_STRRB|nr:Spartin [Strongyloides ratti]CEF68304.1 Spartin [Strongyloides ratti]
MKPLRFVKAAITKPQYYKTYGAYGASGFMLAVYFCDWKAVGQYIPLWNEHFKMDPNIVESFLTEVLAFFEQGICYDDDGEKNLAIKMYKHGLELLEEAEKIPETKNHELFDMICEAKKKVILRLSNLEKNLDTNNIKKINYDDISNDEMIKVINISGSESSKTNSKDGKNLKESVDNEAEVIFFIPEGVQLFVIDGESASIPTYPTSLQILKFKEKSPKINENIKKFKPDAFIQVGPWVYPLIPGKTPVLKNEFNIYVVPNPTEEQPTMCVGIMIPDTLGEDVKKSFEETLNAFTEIRVNDNDEMKNMSKDERKRFSQKIAKLFIKGGDKIAGGIYSSTQKVSSIIQKTGEKHRSNIQPNDNPANINPVIKHSIFYIHKGSKMFAKVTRGLLDAVGDMGMKIGSGIANTIGGNNPSRITTGTFNIIGGGVTGVSTVWMSLENASKILFRNIADETVESVRYKYGEDAATTTHKAMYAAGHTTISGIQLWDLGPRSVAARMARKAGVQFVHNLSGGDLHSEVEVPLEIKKTKKNE